VHLLAQKKVPRVRRFLQRFFRSVLPLFLCIACVMGCGGTMDLPNTPAAVVDSNPSATPSNVPGSHPSSQAAATQSGSQNAGAKSGSTQSSNPPKATLPAPKYPLLHQGASGPAVLRLQQLLAAYGYLPVTWTPSAPQDSDALHSVDSIQSPPDGTWTWRYTNTPSSLKNLWKPGTYTVLVKGAVMTYQEAHNLAIDGIAGPQVWSSLLRESKAHHNPFGYSYVQVSLARPQKLTVWWNGKTVLTSLANAGIPQSPTVKGTYPVYLRYRSQTMSGVTPWGEHYSDPGVPWVSYFYKGEAVHGFVRPGYGYPQSLGCVELPVKQAEIAWKYMHYGTLVHVY
jgi:peptidoglycan hydrolase-like protein with peptidoglycan-binding domain